MTKTFSKIKVYTPDGAEAEVHLFEWQADESEINPFAFSVISGKRARLADGAELIFVGDDFQNIRTGELLSRRQETCA